MGDPLTIYLHDHLAGSVAGVHLVEGLRDQHAGQPLSRFAAELLAEIQLDQQTLEELAEAVGAGGNPLKDAAAWVGEKVSALKLGKAARSRWAASRPWRPWRSGSSASWRFGGPSRRSPRLTPACRT